jgi:excisionase family DNA binding protein
MATHPLRRAKRKPAPLGMADIAKSYRFALRHLGKGRAIMVHAAGTTQKIPLPPMAAKMLGSVLTALGDGLTVSISTQAEDLTTVEAARRLGVSRPFLISQIEAGRLPCRMVGSHRRIRPEDLNAFSTRMERSNRALQELADQAQDLGLGY